MKNTFFFLLLILPSSGVVFAQNYEFKDDKQRSVLFVDGKKFSGPRSEIWKLEKNLAPQPVSSDLLLLSTMESITTDVWQYFLLRFIDGEWEYITSFPGGVAPVVMLTNTEFSAFQRAKDTGIKTNYLIRQNALNSGPQRKWELVKY